MATRSDGDITPAADVVAQEKDAANGEASVRSMTYDAAIGLSTS